MVQLEGYGKTGGIWYSQRDMEKMGEYGTVRELWKKWGDIVQSERYNTTGWGDVVQSERYSTTGGIWYSQGDVVKLGGYGTVREIKYNWGDMVQSERYNTTGWGYTVHSERYDKTGGIWHSQRDIVQLGVYGTVRKIQYNWGGGDMVQSERYSTKGGDMVQSER